MGYSPRGRKESDTTERLHLQLIICIKETEFLVKQNTLLKKEDKIEGILCLCLDAYSKMHEDQEKLMGHC